MLTILLGLFSAFAFASDLRAQTPLYQGKTISIVVGTSAGSTYDVYARAIAQYLGKHIPGNPNILVQNMAGAGSLISANYVYGVAKPDGLTLASINPALYFNQLAGRKEVQFDWAKFAWIGSPDRSEHLIYMRADSPFKTIHDVRRASEPPKCGATGTGTTGHYMPRLIEETIGAKFNIVLGYPGGPEVDLAVERGEIHCRAFTLAAWVSGELYRTWRANGFTRVLIQTGRKRDPRLPEVPTLFELMSEVKTEDVPFRLAAVVLASNAFGRPYVVHPGTPSEQVNILREGFMKTFADPEFLADAKKRNTDIEPTSGAELEKLAKEVMVQPPAVIERMKKLLGI